MKTTINFLRYLIATALLLAGIPLVIATVILMIPFAIWVILLDVVTPGHNSTSKILKTVKLFMPWKKEPEKTS